MAEDVRAAAYCTTCMGHISHARVASRTVWSGLPLHNLTQRLFLQHDLRARKPTLLEEPHPFPHSGEDDDARCASASDAIPSTTIVRRCSDVDQPKSINEAGALRRQTFAISLWGSAFISARRFSGGQCCDERN